jgi:hypothetical protein
MEQIWKESLAAENLEIQRLTEAHDAVASAQAWFLTREAVGPVPLIDISSDDFEAEVAGESHYQVALEEIGALETGRVRRRDVVAVLRPEPENSKDPNAIRVEIFGRLVGRIPREDAEDLSPILLRLAGLGFLAACKAELVGGGRSRAGQELSFGVRLLMADPYEWGDVPERSYPVRSP